MSVLTLLDEIENSPLVGPQELLRWMKEPFEVDRKIPQHRAILDEIDFTAKTLGSHVYKELTPLTHEFVPVSGGSFLTGTSVEVLNSTIATGTQLNTFTTTNSVQLTLPNTILPAGFFLNAGAAGKAVRATWYLRMGATATPTFTFTTRLTTTSTWAATGVSVASAALTAAAQTLHPVRVTLDIVARALTTGATGLTLAMMGWVEGGAFLASPFTYPIPTANTAFTVTLDNTVTQYLFLDVACGTSNASNLVQCEMLKHYGEN
jgi:hypothetical protein